MGAASQGLNEWIDGFLFVANRPILDFLNTKPVLADGPTELLPDVHALERWLIASGIATASKTKSLLKSWRNTSEAAAFLEELIAFRERLRSAVMKIEGDSLPPDSFLAEVNSLLLRYPSLTSLDKR
ncbi:MAG TPA: ABATE domain-containing protein, partial [Edaphobacter sp.]